MKKRIISLVLVLVLMSVVFAGCTKKDTPVDGGKPADTTGETKGNLVDGIYLVKMPVSDHGNYPMAKLEVKDGQIVGVNYFEVAVEAGDGVEIGDIKSKDNYTYEAPFETIKSMQKLIIDNNGTENLELDGISGQHIQEMV